MIVFLPTYIITTINYYFTMDQFKANKFMSALKEFIIDMEQNKTDLKKVNEIIKYVKEILKMNIFYTEEFLSWLMNESKVSSYAQFILGKMYECVYGVVKDTKEAMRYYNLSANQNNSYAQNKLGEIYWYGNLGVKEDLLQAFNWHKLSADEGNLNGMLNLAYDYLYYPEKKDYVEALRLAKLLVEAEDSDGQNLMGYIHDNALGVKQDSTEALKWYKLSADQQNATGQYNVGSCYYNGNGIVKGRAEALVWFKLSANNGESDSGYQVGKMYMKGEGVTKSPKKAVEWFKLASTDNYELAQYELGLAYKNGLGG